MNYNKFLITICIILIIIVSYGHYINVNDHQIIIDKQAQIIEPVSHNTVIISDKNIIKDNTLKKDKIAEKSNTNKLSIKIDENLNGITAESYLVGNLETSEIYIDFNSDKIFPIASLSKLFTALIDKHIMDDNKLITITQSMLDAYGDAGHLVLDEKLTAEELLYPLLLESSNDAAEALAQSYGYDAFIKYMNDLAKEIGMDSTSFKDASGLSPFNISNSKDLFTLSKYYYNNEKDLLAITRIKDISLATTTDHGFHHFFSINPFVFYTPFIGGKTGRTDEALESMVTMLNFNSSTKTYPIVIILLRSQYGQREIDTEKILELFNKKINKVNL